MEFRLFNTLSGKLEDFHPLKDSVVRMYSCGPTVYDYGHIGNFRTFVFVDILRRFLRQRGYKLDHVMNITDVDDKIIVNAAKAQKSLADYTREFTKAFFEDAAALRLEKHEHVAPATVHIPEMVEAIQKLAAKN